MHSRNHISISLVAALKELSAEYTVSQKMCHPILMIILSNLNRYPQFFYCWKVCKICKKTVPTIPKSCCHTTSKNLNLLRFLHIILCSNKRQLPNSWWKFRNIITKKWLEWDFMHHSVNLRHIFLTHNQIVSRVNIFFMVRRHLQVCWLCQCLTTFSAVC